MLLSEKNLGFAISESVISIWFIYVFKRIRNNEELCHFELKIDARFEFSGLKNLTNDMYENFSTKF